MNAEAAKYYMEEKAAFETAQQMQKYRDEIKTLRAELAKAREYIGYLENSLPVKPTQKKFEHWNAVAAKGE